MINNTLQIELNKVTTDKSIDEVLTELFKKKRQNIKGAVSSSGKQVI